MLRKLLLMMATCLLMAMAASPAVAQEGQTASDNPCGIGQSYLPEVNGCFVVEGLPDPIIDIPNLPIYDADTGEELGLFKNVVDLSEYNTTEDYCGAFPLLSDGTTAQDYYDGTSPQQGAFNGYVANAQERELLDPNGDGVACTAEDLAFTSNGMGDDATDDGVADNGTTPPAGDGMADDEMSELPDTGGPLLLPLAFGFAFLGIGGLLLKRR